MNQVNKDYRPHSAAVWALAFAANVGVGLLFLAVFGSYAVAGFYLALSTATALTVAIYDLEFRRD